MIGTAISCSFSATLTCLMSPFLTDLFTTQHSLAIPGEFFSLHNSGHIRFTSFLLRDEWQHQHYLEACYEHQVLGPTLIILNSNMHPISSLVYTLKFEKHWLVCSECIIYSLTFITLITLPTCSFIGMPHSDFHVMTILSTILCALLITINSSTSYYRVKMQTSYLYPTVGLNSSYWCN